MIIFIYKIQWGLGCNMGIVLRISMGIGFLELDDLSLLFFLVFRLEILFIDNMYYC